MCSCTLYIWSLSTDKYLWSLRGNLHCFLPDMSTASQTSGWHRRKNLQSALSSPCSSAMVLQEKVLPTNCSRVVHFKLDLVLSAVEIGTSYMPGQTIGIQLLQYSLRAPPRVHPKGTWHGHSPCLIFLKSHWSTSNWEILPRAPQVWSCGRHRRGPFVFFAAPKFRGYFGQLLTCPIK
jgi:hypothetical protein